jgi:hypothetical protein
MSGLSLASRVKFVSMENVLASFGTSSHTTGPITRFLKICKIHPAQLRTVPPTSGRHSLRCHWEGGGTWSQEDIPEVHLRP